MLNSYTNLLVPVDGSVESEAALKRAIKLALDTPDAKLHILNIIDTRAFQNVASFDDTMVHAVSDEAEKSLQEYQKLALDSGVKNVTYSVEYGSPKTLIAKEIPTKYNSDLIVLGATGLNTVERLVIGSVTEYVTRQAKVDVLVVRAEKK